MKLEHPKRQRQRDREEGTTARERTTEDNLNECGKTGTTRTALQEATVKSLASDESRSRDRESGGLGAVLKNLEAGEARSESGSEVWKLETNRGVTFASGDNDP